jgi:protein phosphatase
MRTITLDGGSIQGRRYRQEDAWGFGHVPDGRWAAVADGMGGGRDGQMAASVAMNAISHYVETTPWAAPMSEWLEYGVMAAHHAVEALAQPDEPTPPGTTLLWAVARKAEVWIVHVGDSRAYVVRDHRVEPLTLDMTPAGDRVKRGEAPWDHQNTAADSHVLLSCIGYAPLLVETFSVDWQPGDVLVLTTDGLNAVSLSQWPVLVESPRPVNEILAASDGGDNATVVLLRHPS